MSNHPFGIMIVDDITENRMLLEAMLEDDYDLSFASSGQECLEKMPEAKPDLVLLDISMPDMDGYEVCRRIVCNPDAHDVPIIFVSALISAEERLAGFEAGGDEYVTKPIDDQELFEKIDKSMAARSQSLRLKSSADDAMNIAMEAMVSGSELGVLNQFMRDSVLSHSFEELGEALLTVSEHFGLNCCAQFRSECRVINIQCHDESLEARLLDKFYGGDKFVDFGARTIVNCEHAAVLVKNMPIEDDAKYGRLRDHLSVLIDAVDNKIVALNLFSDLDKQRDNMVSNLISNNDEQLEGLREKISHRDETTRRIMKEVIVSVEESLFSLGLDEDQEKRLIAMLDEGVQKVEALPGFHSEIEASFSQAREALIKLLSS